jgi:hypothetical protein
MCLVGHKACVGELVEPGPVDTQYIRCMLTSHPVRLGIVDVPTPPPHLECQLLRLGPGEGPVLVAASRRQPSSQHVPTYAAHRTTQDPSCLSQRDRVDGLHQPKIGVDRVKGTPTFLLQGACRRRHDTTNASGTDLARKQKAGGLDPASPQVKALALVVGDTGFEPVTSSV